MKKLNLRKEDGSLNWKFILIGTSWKKFLVTTLWFIAVLMMAYGYKNDIEQYKEVYENPCEFCSQITYINPNTFEKLNLSELNISVIENETKKEGTDSSAS